MFNGALISAFVQRCAHSSFLTLKARIIALQLHFCAVYYVVAMNEPADATCIAASERVRGRLQFYDQWLTEFPWLCFEDGKMFCTVCMSQDSTSGQFVNGSTSFHKHSLIPQ